MTTLVIGIVIGLIVWLALPLFFSDSVKKKSKKKAVGLICKIIGIAIIALSIIQYVVGLFGELSAKIAG